MKKLCSFNLKGRTILLTGAGGHLGTAIARELAAAGAHILLNGRNAGALETLARRLSRGQGKASVRAFDITSEESVRKEIKKIGREFGSLEGIVHNAFALPASVTGSGSQDFAGAYQMAVTAPFLLTEMAIPLLKKGGKKAAGGSSVVHVSSMYGWVSPNPQVYRKGQKGNPPHYGAAKAAVHQLTRHWACHLAPYNIRVNTISPGPFPSPAALQTEPLFAASLGQKVPLGRIGQPEEIAGPLLFLLSPASSYVTGINLPVDGGWTAW